MIWHIVKAEWPLSIGVVAIIFFWSWIKRHTVFHDSVGRGRMSPEECEGCHGYGEQMLIDPDLDGGGWQPVPGHLRSFGGHLEPWQSGSKQANTRPCPYCGGLGHHWRLPPTR